MWLEMARDSEHGGEGWEFRECLWAPSRKTSGEKWAFWETLLKVREGDVVFHLLGQTHSAKIIGYSTADSNGYVTDRKPTKPRGWGYSASYYRVPLRDYTPLLSPVLIDNVFISKNTPLLEYFENNKQRRGRKHEHLFYVFQSGRLQCLNGAYLSNFSEELAGIILNLPESIQSQSEVAVGDQTEVGEQYRNVKTRAGQHDFAENVKSNYRSHCCFPNCDVGEKMLLVGAHIARWADSVELRGQTSNGLCFCPAHDKAFEIGLFTLGPDYRVRINPRYRNLKWVVNHLLRFENRKIRLGQIAPSLESLKLHWERIEFVP